MSIRRLAAAAAIVLIAVLCVPAALPPGVNSADFVVLFAPIALVVVVARPRRPKTPAGGAEPPPLAPTHPTSMRPRRGPSRNTPLVRAPSPTEVAGVTMNRLQLRRPAGLKRRRPLRARRLSVAHDAPVEYSSTEPTPRWVPVVVGVLGAAVTAQAIVGVAVLL